MAESTIQFHCVICFELFDSCDRYPIVLSCGHTFLCVVCARRLDRCMECRTSLFYPVDENQPVNRINQPVNRTLSRSAMGSSANRRNPFSPTHDERLKKKKDVLPVRKRLPLPKNLVLLSLIETERNSSNLVDLCKGIGISSAAQKQDVDRLKVNIGVSIAIGAYGTFIVTAHDGLKISSSLPTAEIDESRTDVTVDRILTKIIWEFKNNSGVDESRVEDEKELKTVPQEVDQRDEKREQDINALASIDISSNVNENPSRLEYGDKVQIVSFINGWAKLARRKGYVNFQNSELAKVGGPIDESCRVEGILHSLLQQTILMDDEREQITHLKDKLIKELAVALTDKDVTVIQASPSTRSFQSNFGEGDTVKLRPNSSMETKCVLKRRKKTDNNRRRDEAPAIPSVKKGVRVNYQTGFSGHSALLSANVRPIEPMKKSNSKSVLHISDHSGLNIPKRLE